MMYDIIRIPDEYRIEYGEGEGAQLDFEVSDSLKIFLTASGCTVKTVRLRWNVKTESEVKILSDEWERTYGKTEWRGIVAERMMPWYMLVSDRVNIYGIGVKVRPSAMCAWQLDRGGITLVLDVRSGGVGVRLDGRRLMAAEAVKAEYTGMSEFEAAKRFCMLMSDSAKLPDEPVYGSNNWYYAYGDSSYEDIMKDSEFVSELTKGISNRPWMVIDDGWEINRCCGPWVANERFRDMNALAEDMKNTGVKPGIWFRPLYDASDFATQKHLLPGTKQTLDPTLPEVLDYVAENVSRIREWGYGLIKHDFSSYDICGEWGGARPKLLTKDGRMFSSDTHTTAEIAKRLYKTIYDSANGMIVLGCNCLSHLCVGYVHINRTGDDTSGRYWERTRFMGVNTLAFRLCQDGSFYKSDADCVGITNQVSWEYNRQWLDLLSRSGTPLFVSAKIPDINGEMKNDLKTAFERAAIQKTGLEALDWTYNTAPSLWKDGDEYIEYRWDDKYGVDSEAKI